MNWLDYSLYSLQGTCSFCIFHLVCFCLHLGVNIDFDNKVLKTDLGLFFSISLRRVKP